MRYLKYGLKCVVVNEFVHIEGGEDVECVAKVDFPRNGCIVAEDRKKVCGADDRIDVNNGHDPIAVAINVWLDNPHTVVGVRVVEGFGKEMNKRTGEYLLSELKRKE